MSAAHSDLDAVLARIDADLDQSLERLDALLRIPSISTEAAYREDCRRAAETIRADLAGLGFDAALVDVPEVPTGHPMVLGQSADRPGRRRVLFYGHYDVQPVDPLDLWDHPPFEPRIETRADGSKIIRARGAADDKGQLMTFLEAVRAWKAVTGETPVDITVLIEGEEEAGGASMGPFLTSHADRLKADLALVCDTSMWSRTRAAITASLRGMAAGTLRLRAASRDLHSGYYGGAATNPNHVLARIIADLHDDQGRVTLKGFYDGVPETPAEIKAIWDGLGFDPAAFLGEVDLSQPSGEADRSVLEQCWARPTAEVNGMIGGYTGDGFKTVIPAEAMAKVSFRLVGTQDPKAVWAAFEAHVRERLPADCEANFENRSGGGAEAISLPYESPELAAAARALDAEWDEPTAVVGAGGSIPVVGDFKRRLGLDTLLIGFGLDDDRIHSPNEKYELTSFHKGIRSWARVMAELAAAR